MKRLLVVPIVLLVLIACNNGDTNNDSQAIAAGSDSANYTSVKWLDSAQNLGMLKFGEKKEISFHFQNTGNKPLFIISAQPGCGCTVADFPKGAIAAGDEGKVVAAFDTNKSHPGHFLKSITVTTNTTGTSTHMLTFEGDISEAPTKDSTGKRS
ncbi:DUF1573 domain-containing protein [Segetibacter sp. 3557_3]|uniref:DUF1573 domain-containing protein n=1 Tax=Segetibacter sp. 3557_3 TaxID=2547429 RepID=UPI001058794F|nr:DUF1573 domain-containing protein [Segetibacter sp. 3557_3]TDH28510.1 DUF1573 domain-containing protein [Segetibacter sp. 3557_3]